MKKRKSQSNSAASVDIPIVFKERMANLLGEDYPALLASMSEAPLAGLRVNTLKIMPRQFMHITPYQLAPVSWCPTGFYLDESKYPGYLPPGRHPQHTAGLYYLQEPSAMAAGEVLSPHPGERVLDLAAAPGGKSTHLACLMKNEGILVTNEIHPRRVWDLAENLERCGVTNAIVTNETPERLAAHFGEYFDRVMLDAPCSGEGMFRKSETARIEWKPDLPVACASRQEAILEQAARLVKPGGFLSYTTCTFSPPENEGVIARFLEKHHEFEIMPIKLAAGFSPAHPEWCQSLIDERMRYAIRIWPHLARGEGHFIALLAKVDSSGQYNNFHGKFRREVNKTGDTTSAGMAKRIYKEFERGNLAISLNEDRLLLKGSYIYHLPADYPDLGLLNIIHPGWWLGVLHKERFSPSHALALGIHPEHANQVLALNSGDRDVYKFLHGESLNQPGENGWLLVTVDGYPLGWGKRVNHVVKNYYPRGLRQAS